jgi:hypothetical protein
MLWLLYTWDYNPWYSMNRKVKGVKVTVEKKVMKITGK